MKLLNVICWRIWCYFLLTLITISGILHFFFALALFPIKFVSKSAYRQAITWQLYFSVPGFLCIPFSWAGCKARVHSLGRLKLARGKDQLLLANHSGRIDWLFGTYAGRFYGQRVGFVTEAFITLLPFVGWHRWMVEDMFVYRSFKRDRDHLLANVEAFKESKVTRWVFLCPEGHIADFNNADKQYISNCEQFCKDQGYEPFKMALTPRYKGMQCFSKIIPDELDSVCVSATMTYVQNGERLVKPLRCDTRVIPDLWNIVNMKLECYIHIHGLELGDQPELVKKQLMEDYSLKDKLLQEFYETGSFPNAYPGKTIAESPELWKPLPDYDLPLKKKKRTNTKRDIRIDSVSSNLPESESLVKKNYGTDENIDYFQELPPNHLFMNISFFAQMYCPVWVMGKLGLESLVLPAFMSMYILMVVSHMVGEYMANGQSRESLPFEGIFKAIMFRYQGIEGNDQPAAEEQKK